MKSGCIGVSFLFASVVASAAPPETLMIQGAMTSAGGVLAPDGDYLVIVTLWDAESDGLELWKETVALTVAPASTWSEMAAILPAEMPMFRRASRPVAGSITRPPVSTRS